MCASSGRCTVPQVFEQIGHCYLHSQVHTDFCVDLAFGPSSHQKPGSQRSDVSKRSLTWSNADAARCLPAAVCAGSEVPLGNFPTPHSTLWIQPAARLGASVMLDGSPAAPRCASAATWWLSKLSILDRGSGGGPPGNCRLASGFFPMLLEIGMGLLR